MEALDGCGSRIISALDAEKCLAGAKAFKQ